MRKIACCGARSSGATSHGAAAGPSATTVPLRYDVRIQAPSTLQIRNNTLRLVASADVRLTGTFDKPVILGRVEVNRGEATPEDLGLLMAGAKEGVHV